MKIKSLLLVLFVISLVFFNVKRGNAMGNKPSFELMIREKMKTIDISDGVSKEEAITLAQNQILKDNQERIFDLKSAEIFGENDPFWNKNSWHISFKVKSREWLRRGIKWCSLHVNKMTGEVTDGGCGPS